MRIYNEDCIAGSLVRFPEPTAKLLVCDPPFGIHETDFDKHYKRDDSHVIEGYVEAPEDYALFTEQWLTQAERMLLPDGSMYVVSGWTNLRDVLNGIKKVGLETINHIIWKYNFGTFTTRKYVSSHYHILYVKKKGGKVTFNTDCRFGPQEKDDRGGSLNFQDLEDVFVINKDYVMGDKDGKVKKNENKLPDELLRKIILYSSCPGDIVGDLFLGNFTTAKVAKRLGRVPVGFEKNLAAFEYHMKELADIEVGCDLKTMKVVEVKKPENQGKKVSQQDREAIYGMYCELEKEWHLKKGEISVILQERFKRGQFSIKNILDVAKELAAKATQINP